MAPNNLTPFPYSTEFCIVSHGLSSTVRLLNKRVMVLVIPNIRRSTTRGRNDYLLIVAGIEGVICNTRCIGTCLQLIGGMEHGCSAYFTWRF